VQSRVGQRRASTGTRDSRSKSSRPEEPPHRVLLTEISVKDKSKPAPRSGVWETEGRSSVRRCLKQRRFTVSNLEARTSTSPHGHNVSNARVCPTDQALTRPRAHTSQQRDASRRACTRRFSAGPKQRHAVGCRAELGSAVRLRALGTLIPRAHDLKNRCIKCY
jgi:hypothetical protein